MCMVSKIGEGDGGAVFRVNKLCGRCEYTNVDPETGTKVPRGEVHKVSPSLGPWGNILEG